MARRDHPAPHGSEAPPETEAPRSDTSVQEPVLLAQLDLEDLKIDRAGEIPIGVQLAWGLRARIGDGRLAPGQRLPGLRELAEMLGINANTARTVYQRLEQEGLIDSRQGTGTFVASVAQEPSAVGQIAADAARQAHQTGVDPREVAAALYVAAEPGPDPATRASERRSELRAQIAALEQTLSEMQSNHPGLIPTPSRPSSRHAGPRLLGVEELEGVRMELVHRVAAAEPFLQTPAEDAKAAKAAKRRTSDVEEPQATTPKPAKDRRTSRARPQTRPSTA